jgi:hypothetical protein|tara:strand:+ start:77 stop:1339 length:1263 start_codon:yes stop_codon:yes gene_type:complete
MFDWIDDAADAVVDGAIKAAQAVGKVAAKIGTVGLMGLSYVLPAVGAKIGQGVIAGMQALGNVGSSVIKAFTGLMDYTMELVGNGKNFISNISEAVINTGKNFVQTLGNKLGLTEKGASSFFGAGDSAWSRSTGDTTDFDQLVTQAGGEEQFTSVIAETVVDASPVVVKNEVDPRLMEASTVAITPQDVQLEASLDELKPDLLNPSEISGIEGEVVTEMPERYDTSALFDVEDSEAFTAFSPQDLVSQTDLTGVQGPVVELGPDQGFFGGDPEYQELEVPKEFRKSLLAKLDDTKVKLGKVAKESWAKAKTKTSELVTDAPSLYLDERARSEVARKVNEDTYGTPEEQFQTALAQQRQITAMQASATPNTMMQFTTLTGGASQTSAFNAYTSAPLPTNNLWGANAYQSNVYGNRMSQFGY